MTEMNSIKANKRSFTRSHPASSSTLMSAEEEAQLAKRLFGLSDDENDKDSDSASEEEYHGSSDIRTQSNSASVWQDDDDNDPGEVFIPKRRKAVQLLKKAQDKNDLVSKQVYQERLRSAFQRTHNAGKVPKWARTDGKSVVQNEDEDDEVLQTLAEMTRSTSNYVVKDSCLPKGALDFQPLPEITIGHRQTKSLSVLRFHPSKPVLLTAHRNGAISLFEVDNDAKREHFLQNVVLPKFSLSCMEFIADRSAVLCGALDQNYFYKYDLVTGQVSQAKMPHGLPKQNLGKFAVSLDGSLVATVGFSSQVHILATASMEHVTSFAVSSPPVSVQFLPGSNNELWIMTESGRIEVHEIKSHKRHTFVDDGVVKGSCMMISSDGEKLASGSNTGIVNVYDINSARSSSEPKPELVISSLVTGCTAVALNHNSQAIAVASNVKTNHVKIVHLQTGVTFSNFPAFYEKIGNVESVQFSPHSGYLAVGASNGALRVYRLTHFDDY